MVAAIRERERRLSKPSKDKVAYDGPAMHVDKIRRAQSMRAVYQRQQIVRPVAHLNRTSRPIYYLIHTNIDGSFNTFNFSRLQPLP